MSVLILGLLISFLATVIGILNIATSPSRDFSIASLIGLHAVAMIGMSLGGLLSFVGAVMIVIDLVKGS